jgi:hypothetical protein
MFRIRLEYYQNDIISNEWCVKLFQACTRYASVELYSVLLPIKFEAQSPQQYFIASENDRVCIE